MNENINGKFEITKQLIPEDVMETLREAMGVDCMDTIADEEILQMPGWKLLDMWLSYNGIINWTSEIIEIFGYAYGVNFNEHPFDTTPEREVD